MSTNTNKDTITLLNPTLDELAKHPRYGVILGRALSVWRSGGSFPQRHWFGFGLSLTQTLVVAPGLASGQCMVGAALVGLVIPGGMHPLAPLESSGLEQFELVALMDGFDAEDTAAIRKAVAHAVDRAVRAADRAGKRRKAARSQESIEVAYLGAAADAVQFAVNAAIALGLSNPLDVPDPEAGQTITTEEGEVDISIGKREDSNGVKNGDPA